MLARTATEPADGATMSDQPLLSGGLHCGHVVEIKSFAVSDSYPALSSVLHHRRFHVRPDFHRAVFLR
jgi:hypothetical protein